mmetsp:Transcript_83009/g.221784  ORF Transcript_83009/g.221784 Transcript_83009/m.221784 type:complete len:225 (+) Transcript_83009:64-738(+)
MGNVAQCCEAETLADDTIGRPAMAQPVAVDSGTATALRDNKLSGGVPDNDATVLTGGGDSTDGGLVSRTEQYKDGSVYKGQMKETANGMVRHGHGSLESGNGTGGKYVGQWKDNQQHGTGLQTWKDGRSYEGQFVNDRFHGEGKMTWKTEEGTMTYAGSYVDDKKEGHGEFKWPDGRAYVGQWHGGKRHGVGKYTTTSGNVRLGQWEHDKLTSWAVDGKEQTVA